MRRTILLSAFATAATLGAAAGPLVAQQPTTAPVDRPRVIATYDFGNRWRDISFPRLVTVADSAGTIVARASIPADGREVPMEVTIIDSNLVLQSLTSDGVLTLVLEGQNDIERKSVTNGTWEVGTTRGTLRLRAKN